MKISGILTLLLSLVVALSGQTTRGQEVESEELVHLQEQIIRVILDTDASQLESERERDSAVAKSSRLKGENARLQAQVGYLRAKLNRQDLPTPASAGALSSAIKRLWDDGAISPPDPDPALRYKVMQLRERLRQAEEARKDLSLALQVRTINSRDNGQTQLLEATRRRIATLESELALAKSQVRQKPARSAPGQSPAALTQRIRKLEAQNRHLRMRADSVKRQQPTAVKVTTAWQVELKRRMDSIQYENEMLTQTVNDLRQTASRRFDKMEVDAQETAIIERTLAEITIREQTVRERERLIDIRERDMERRAERYRDLEEREVRLRMLERKLKENGRGE